MILFEWSNSLPVCQVHAECVDAWIAPSWCISIVAHANHTQNGLFSSIIFSSFFTKSLKVSVFHFVDIKETAIIWSDHQTIIVELE